MDTRFACGSSESPGSDSYVSIEEAWVVYQEPTESASMPLLDFGVLNDN
jgi:hypothetical protein